MAVNWLSSMGELTSSTMSLAFITSAMLNNSLTSSELLVLLKGPCAARLSLMNSGRNWCQQVEFQGVCVYIVQPDGEAAFFDFAQFLDQFASVQSVERIGNFQHKVFFFQTEVRHVLFQLAQRESVLQCFRVQGSEKRVERWPSFSPGARCSAIIRQAWLSSVISPVSTANNSRDSILLKWLDCGRA